MRVRKHVVRDGQRKGSKREKNASDHHIPSCQLCDRDGDKETEEFMLCQECVCVCVSMYLELDADILRHELDRGFFEDLEVPVAEHLHGQDAVRFVDAETLTKRL